MSEKKMSEGRRKWKMNAIALLKPLVVEGNHISRRIAVKLVKPTNDWERRQLDTLRGQANKIIRRENTDPLLYTVWGMSLEHPNMAMAKKIAAVMPQGNAYGSPFVMPKSDFLSACGATPMVRGKVATADNLPETGEQGDLYYVEELNFEPVGHNGTDWVSTYPPFEVVKKCLPIAKGARRVFGGQTEFWDGKQWVLSLDEHETHQVAVMDPARQEKQSVWQRLKRIAGFK